MEQIKIPMGYHADLNLHDTQVAIKTVKDFKRHTNSKIKVIFNVFKELDYEIYRELLG